MKALGRRPERRRPAAGPRGRRARDPRAQRRPAPRGRRDLHALRRAARRRPRRRRGRSLPVAPRLLRPGDGRSAARPCVRARRVLRRRGEGRTHSRGRPPGSASCEDRARRQPSVHRGRGRGRGRLRRCATRSAGRASAAGHAPRRGGDGPGRPPQPLEGLPGRQGARRVDPAGDAGGRAAADGRARGGDRRGARANVRLADGSAVPWDALLLATGAEVDPPRRPGRPTAPRPHACARSPTAGRSSRRRGRARSVRSSSAPASSGSRWRRRCASGALPVDVVAAESPLGKILGPEAGAFVEGLHREHGVALAHRRRRGRDHAGRVRLTSGAVLAADLVVIGIGVRPATALAERAGLRVDRGILVDERLRTSATGVFAAGDAARWPDERFGGPSAWSTGWWPSGWVLPPRARSSAGRRRSATSLLLERPLRRDVHLRRPRPAVGPHRRARHARGARRHARLSRQGPDARGRHGGTRSRSASKPSSPSSATTSRRSPPSAGRASFRAGASRTSLSPWGGLTFTSGQPCRVFEAALFRWPQH